MSAPSGWIPIILGIVLIVIMVFAFYHMNRSLKELKLEMEGLRGILDETKKNAKDVKIKLEEV